MIHTYVKLPVHITAVHWNGDNLQECIDFLGIYFIDNRIERSPNGKREIRIRTLEGIMTASKGDYIICGVNNEFYPCKPDIFEKTYNIVK